MKIKNNIFGIAEGLTAILLTIGSLTFFSACKGHDGSFMVCHWAQNAVVVFGIVLILQSLFRIFIPNRAVKTGLSISILLASAAVIFIPGIAIDLCMMDTMHCQSMFKPAVRIVASVLVVVSGFDSALGLLRFGKKE